MGLTIGFKEAAASLDIKSILKQSQARIDAARPSGTKAGPSDLTIGINTLAGVLEGLF